MDSSSSRRRAPICDDFVGIGDDDLEEGEYVPSADYYHASSDTDDDDRSDHHHQSSRREAVHPQHGGGRMRRLDDIIAVGGRVGGAGGAPLPLPPASPTPSSESDEGTVSDHRSGASSGGVGGGARKFACHVCSKGFSSRKAVDGHMRVHGSGSGGSGSGGRHVVAAQAAPFISGGWAATGRRGCIGGKPSSAAVSLNFESTGHSTAIVAVPPPQPQVQQPLEPVPMAFAVTTTNLSPLPSSTRTNLSAGEDDVGSSASATATAQPMHCDHAAAAAVVTGANPSSSTGAGADAGARAAGLVNDKLAAAADQAPVPQVNRQAVSVPPPAAQQGHFAQQPLVPPSAAAPDAVQLQQGGQLVPLPLPLPAQPPREYSCKVCGKTYPTHQGLGGHAAGHRNRQREEEAMAAAAGMMMLPNGGGGDYLAALRRGRKAEEPHACQKCHKVFPTGVALGGHMRMHYTGPPIVHKNKKRQPPPPVVTEADLRLALSNALSTARIDEPSTSAAPAVAGTGRLRLFGFDIGPLGQQAPPEQEQQGSGSGSGTTEEGGPSSAGEHQQHK